MTVLPADLRAAVEAFIADLDLDLTSAAATSGRCESVSRKLATHLRDEGFVAFEASAWGVNDVPAAVDAVTDSESGEGEIDGVRVYAYHYVTRVEAADEAGVLRRWMIDLTAAQYASTLGWTGPRFERGGEVY